MKQKKGIILCIVFLILFEIITKLLYPHFNGANWYIVSSIQRMIFFIIELLIFIKVFKKEKIRNVINLHNFKYGIIAGKAMILYIIVYIIACIIFGAKTWVNTTIPIVISCLFLQQLTTGLWEELTFRTYICEGYYQNKTKTSKKRLKYALIASIIFGLAHVIECDSISLAIYRFINTGIWGFAFASIYLYTHNILSVMFLHFFTDIFLNIPLFVKEWSDSIIFIAFDNYIHFILLGIIFIAAIIFIRKEPLKTKNSTRY